MVHPGLAVGASMADTIFGMAERSHVSFEQRMAEKEAARRTDDLAIALGSKSPQQIKLESESFAFGPDRARLDFASLRPLVESVIALTDGSAHGSGRV